MPKSLRAERIAFAVIALLSFLLHLYYNSGVPLSNSDDMLSLMSAERILRGGWAAYWVDAHHLAVEQGRFSFLLWDFVGRLPFLLDSEAARVLLVAAMYVGLCLSLALFMNRLLPHLRPGVPFLAATAYLLPIYGSWYGYYHYPFYWKLPIVLFVITQWLYLSRIDGRVVRASWPWWGAYYVLMFAAISFAEVFFLAFGAWVAMAGFVYIKRRTGAFPDAGEWLRWMKLQLLPFILYLPMYLGWQRNQGAHYMSQFELNLSPVAVGTAVGRFLSGAVPAGPYLWGGAARYWRDAFAEASGTGAFEVAIVCAFALAVTGIAIWSVLRTARCGGPGTVDESGRFGRAALWAAGVALALSVSTIVLHVISKQYQSWLAEFTPWYTTTFFIALSFLCVLALAVTWLLRRTAAQPRYARIAVGGMLFLSIPTALISYGQTQHVRHALMPGNGYMLSLQRLANSSLRKVVADADLVYAPSLMPFGGYPKEESLDAMLGVRSRVTADPHLAQRMLAAGNRKHVAFMHYVADHRDLHDGYLVVGALDNLERVGGRWRAMGHRVGVVSPGSRRYTWTLTADGPPRAMLPLSPEPSIARDARATVAVFPTPVYLDSVEPTGTTQSTTPTWFSEDWQGCRWQEWSKEQGWYRACDAGAGVALRTAAGTCATAVLEGTVRVVLAGTDLQVSALREGEVRLTVGDTTRTVPLTPAGAVDFSEPIRLTDRPLAVRATVVLPGAKSPVRFLAKRWRLRDADVAGQCR